MKCNHCNSEVADGTNFCPNCGNRIEIPQPKICTHCGTKLEEGEKFCPNCGKPANDFAQPNQGQPQSSYQGQYQQPYQTRYQHPQLPQNPKLSFGEAINLASQRLTEANGRSRRSEYWWWVLAIGIVTVVLQFIPYVGSFAYIAQYFLLYAITMRRLHDCSAPEWVGGVYLGTYGAYRYYHISYFNRYHVPWSMLCCICQTKKPIINRCWSRILWSVCCHAAWRLW